MAWNVCEEEVCSQIEHKKKQGISVREALRSLSKESSIPYGTLRRWYYPEKDVPKNGNTVKKGGKKKTPRVLRCPFCLKIWIDNDVTRKQIEEKMKKRREQEKEL